MIAGLKRKFLEEYPTFGHVIQNVRFEIKDEPKLWHFTAQTDGVAIQINKATFNHLPEPRQFFLLAHNVCHIAFKHVQRGADKDKFLWDIASDAVVNQLLRQDGHEIPFDMVNLPVAARYTVEELYRRLRVKQKDPNVQARLDECKEKCKGHDQWNNIKSKAKKFVEKILNQENDEGSGKKAEEIDEQKAFKENAHKKEPWKKELEEMADNEGGQEAGKGKGDKLKKFGDVGTAEKIVNWKRLLREAIDEDDERWGHKLSIKENHYSVRLEDREVDEKKFTEVVIDTSGSVGDELVKAFLRQLKVLIRESDLRVGCFDDGFHGFVNITKGKDIDNFVIRGRGGTDFDTAVNAFSKKADNKIVFTDGYAPMPQKEVKAIWIVTGHDKIQPKGGTVIMVPPEKIISNTNEKETEIEMGMDHLKQFLDIIYKPR